MTPDAALAWFDGLPAVAVDEMIGSWRGEDIPTGHPFDGKLAAVRWWGKRFDSAEAVHPLVHQTGGGRCYCVNPALLPLGLAQALPTPLIAALFPVLRFALGTRAPAARLRTTTYRGVNTATMIYDAKPINDVFRRIDDTSVLGLMDQRGAAAPFFFKLSKAE